MTELTKPIIRELPELVEVFGKHRNRTYVITLSPPNVIKLRLKGTKTEFMTTLEGVLELAKLHTAIRENKEREKIYELKKALGKRVRNRRKKSWVNLFWIRHVLKLSRQWERAEKIKD